MDAHEIGDDDREDRAKNVGADAVEQLHADQPERIVGKRMERATDGQNRQCAQEQALVALAVGSGADQHRERHHHDLAATMQADIRLVPIFLS